MKHRSLLFPSRSRICYSILSHCILPSSLQDNYLLVSQILMIHQSSSTNSLSFPSTNKPQKEIPSLWRNPKLLTYTLSGNTEPCFDFSPARVKDITSLWSAGGERLRSRVGPSFLLMKKGYMRRKESTDGMVCEVWGFEWLGFWLLRLCCAVLCVKVGVWSWTCGAWIETAFVEKLKIVFLNRSLFKLLWFQTDISIICCEGAGPIPLVDMQMAALALGGHFILNSQCTLIVSA